MQPSVSVIIPVYNIEKHLEKCLDSVIGQTLKDIEIIVVNDGSTDNSLNIYNTSTGTISSNPMLANCVSNEQKKPMPI